jgi:hypothetical protein
MSKPVKLQSVVRGEGNRWGTNLNFIPKNREKYKGSLPVKLKSRLERMLCTYLDTEPKVNSWSYESVQITYISPLDGAEHRYYPDFLCVITPPGDSSQPYTALIEVKPNDHIPSPKNFGKANSRKDPSAKAIVLKELINNQAKFAAAKLYCDARAWKFILMTESVLNTKMSR